MQPMCQLIEYWLNRIVLPEYTIPLKKNNINHKCTVLNDHKNTYLSETSQVKKQLL